MVALANCEMRLTPRLQNVCDGVKLLIDAGQDPGTVWCQFQPYHWDKEKHKNYDLEITVAAAWLQGFAAGQERR